MTQNKSQAELNKTPRIMDYFESKGLEMQIGCKQEGWALMLIKELIDNSLDAAERAGRPPEITVVLDENAVTVSDNGDGISLEAIKESMDFNYYASSNRENITPSRGQLGNALKCVYCAPYVATGSEAHIEITASGQCHDLTISFDRLAQQPIVRSQVNSSQITTGTSIRIGWPAIENQEVPLGLDDNGNNTLRSQLHALLRQFSAVNPHSRFTYFNSTIKGFKQEFGPFHQEWKNWQSVGHGSPHWYSVRDLETRITVSWNKDHEALLTGLITKFDGLTSSAAARSVRESSGLTELRSLGELIDGDRFNTERIESLLFAMQTHAKLIRPDNLGAIRKEHLERSLGDMGADDVQYVKTVGIDDNNLPYLIEVAAGRHSGSGNTYLLMLNHSAVPGVKRTYTLQFTWEEESEIKEPVVVMASIVFPKFVFTDHGKGKVELSGKLRLDFQNTLKAVARKLKSTKRKEKREARVVHKDFCYDHMEEAYLKASGRTGMANARQVFYVMRALWMDKSKDKEFCSDSHFTQNLLPDYQKDYPTITTDWDVLYDDRGHFVEPHADHRLGLGTLSVRNYTGQWDDTTTDELNVGIDELYPTKGPSNRFKYALFIEKEGFDALLYQSQIAKRYDLAILSNKGMSNTATRDLIEELSERGVTTLIVHDFDISGHTIAYTLTHDTRRHQFSNSDLKTKVLGLTWAQKNRMKLQSEPVQIKQDSDPREKLRAYGVVNEEALDFLVGEFVEKGRDKYWAGNRVELNAMTADQFVDWLEGELQKLGDTKVLPDAGTLESAWRRATKVASLKEAIVDIETDETEVVVPDDLLERVKRVMTETPELSWDLALNKVSELQRCGVKP